MMHWIYISIHYLHWKICSQNSTVELVLQSWTLQILIYKWKLMKIPKIFTRSTHTRAYFNFAAFHLASSQYHQFSTNNGYITHRIARSFQLYWWHPYYSHNPRGTSASLNFCAGSNPTIWISIKWSTLDLYSIKMVEDQIQKISMWLKQLTASTDVSTPRSFLWYLIVMNISLSNYSVNQAVLIQLIQF